MTQGSYSAGRRVRRDILNHSAKFVVAANEVAASKIVLVLERGPGPIRDLLGDDVHRNERVALVIRGRVYVILGRISIADGNPVGLAFTSIDSIGNEIGCPATIQLSFAVCCKR